MGSGVGEHGQLDGSKGWWWREGEEEDGDDDGTDGDLTLVFFQHIAQPL